MIIPINSIIGTNKVNYDVGGYMSFSCTIKIGSNEITGNKPDKIHHQLLGLGHNCSGDTPSYYSVDDFRMIIDKCKYGHMLPKAAQDTFLILQNMAQANINCFMESGLDSADIIGWSIYDLTKLINYDSNKITYILGGW